MLEENAGSLKVDAVEGKKGEKKKESKRRKKKKQKKMDREPVEPGPNDNVTEEPVLEPGV